MPAPCAFSVVASTPGGWHPLFLRWSLFSLPFLLRPTPFSHAFTFQTAFKSVPFSPAAVFQLLSQPGCPDCSRSRLCQPHRPPHYLGKGRFRRHDLVTSTLCVKSLCRSPAYRTKFRLFSLALRGPARLLLCYLLPLPLAPPAKPSCPVCSEHI